MPEIKNNFLGGKMNKDLDERLISNGEYRDARNVSVSGSESGNSGSIESVIGNIELTDFGLTESHLEIIGYLKDSSNNRVFLFITNYTDSSVDSLSNFAFAASSHYIFMYDLRTSTYTKLVQGRFLNFSKTHPILNAGLIEDLLFWTDDRNQPRKINVRTALSNAPSIETSPYYSKEEHISVAKYYPWNPIRLRELDPNGALNTYQSNLLGAITTAFTGTIADATRTYSIPNGDPNLEIATSGSGTGCTIEVVFVSNLPVSITVTDGGSGFEVGDTLTFLDPVGGAATPMVITLREEDIRCLSTMYDATSLLLPSYTEGTATAIAASNAFTAYTSTTSDLSKYIGCLIRIVDTNGDEVISISDGITLATVGGTSGNYSGTFSANVTTSLNDTIFIGANPHYDPVIANTNTNTRDRFVRFAYRFKFDDNEYSLISPFTQHVFIPKQDGFFLGDDTDIDADEQAALKSSIVEFFENKVTKANLIIDLPEGVSTAADLFSELKVKEIDIIYKDSIEPSLKVLGTIMQEDLVGSTDTYITYEYKSDSAIKVLPERELTRVYDRTPVRAKTQEIVGNRVLYANFIPELPYESELNFSVEASEKDRQHDSVDAYSSIEYPTHTLKQNRKYQVGVILCDKFGRQSDVIISDNNTVFNSFRDTESPLINTTGDDIYLGDSLKITFNEPIPNESKIEGYKGVYDATTNPLGWYSYKVVVKQEEQSYHTCYIPSILNDYPIHTNVGTRVTDLAHITLLGENINKIPRDFTSSSENDDTFSSTASVYPRVTASTYTSTEHTTIQYTDGQFYDKVTSIGTRDELGVDLTRLGVPYNESPFYSIPSVSANGSNPLIARISTSSALGTRGGFSTGTGYIAHDELRLEVVETKPVKSDLDIYYETSTAGLISELNADITSAGDFTGVPYQIDTLGWKLSEGSSNNDVITNDFTIQDIEGNDILNANTTGTIVSVTSSRNGFGESLPPENVFELEKDGGTFKYRIKWIGDTSYPLWYGSPSFDYFDIKILFTNEVSGETVSGEIYLKNNKVINELPLLAEHTTDFGAFDQSLDNEFQGTFSNRRKLVTTGWREISDLDFQNGASVTAAQKNGLVYKITSVKYFNTTSSTYEDFISDQYVKNKTFTNFSFFQTSGLADNDYTQFVRLIDLNDGNGLKLYYSPLLQSINEAAPTSNPWNGLGLPIYMGRWDFASERSLTYRLANFVDPNAGIRAAEADRDLSVDVYRYEIGVIATSFRVFFDVFDFFGNGLYQEQYVDFNLNTDIYY